MCWVKHQCEAGCFDIVETNHDHIPKSFELVIAKSGFQKMVTRKLSNNKKNLLSVESTNSVIIEETLKKETDELA